MPEETCFQGSFAVEGTSQLFWDLRISRRYQPACLSLFLKSEKTPTLLDVGKGPVLRPFSYTKIL
jgi:hypothetical protein